jgi:hypothetical protein
MSDDLLMPQMVPTFVRKYSKTSEADDIISRLSVLKPGEGYVIPNSADKIRVSNFLKPVNLYSERIYRCKKIGEALWVYRER